MAIRTPIKAGAALLALILGACAAPPPSANDEHANMDLQAMCEMHKKMMGSMPPAQQQAMMDEHMKGMSADMRARMQKMHARCK